MNGSFLLLWVELVLFIKSFPLQKLPDLEREEHSSVSCSKAVQTLLSGVLQPSWQQGVPRLWCQPVTGHAAMLCLLRSAA